MIARSLRTLSGDASETRKFFGHERNFSGDLATILTECEWSKGLTGGPCHQFSLDGSSAMACDIIWRARRSSREYVPIMNIEVKSEGQNTSEVRVKARGEAMNQDQRLYVLDRVGGYFEVAKGSDPPGQSKGEVLVQTGETRLPERTTGRHPLLQCLWTPHFVVVTLIVPCTG